MINLNFSEKQLKIITWFLKNKNEDYDAIICDGAIRSGKTLAICVSFILWSFYKFESGVFAISGKSIRSLRKNFLPQFLYILKNLGFIFCEKTNENLIVVTGFGRKNLYYLFSGKDESSASLIQGITLDGVLFDEVVLQPQSFVNQAMARCSSKNSKFFFSCNPDSPFHWFYKSWILNHNLKKAAYFHFDLNDNPSLSEKIKHRYKRIYSGVFYDRFVLGKWVRSEGLVYPFMNNLFYHNLIPDNEFSAFSLSCDYGIINPISCGLWGLLDGTWYRFDEYYYDSKISKEILTDEDHFENINKKLIKNRKIKFITIDYSASSFISLFYKKNYNIICTRFSVIEGINLTSTALKCGKIKICSNCYDTINEFLIYRWQENALKDAPVKENDHAMDDIRYFVCALTKFEENNILALAAQRYF